MEEFKPGQVISPHSIQPASPPEPTPPPTGAPQPDRPTEQPEPAPTPLPEPEPATPPAATTTSPPPTADADWNFTSETDAAAPASAVPADLPADLSWTASEFIAHEKAPSWYGALAAVAIVIAVLVYLVTKDKISTGIVVLAALAFGIFAHRKPQTQQYGLSREGLQIGQKQYDFQEFKTFSVTEDGAIASVVFMPLKRFMPPLTIYVAPDMENQVVEFLSAYLPFQEHKADAVDSLLKRIRF